MKLRRLLSAAIAFALFGCGVAGVIARAGFLERKYIYAFTPRLFALRTFGTALQAEAFRRPDLLPFIGSSGLMVQNRYHPNALLRDYPTGFTTFPIGMAETSSLVMLQKIAALGGDIRGKKLAISLSPGWFFFYDKAPADGYGANFSKLHAGSLIYSTELSWDLKRAAAKRMLDYPDTVADDAILRLGLRRLAGDSWLDAVGYGVLMPLGLLQNALLRLQDHWATFKLIGDRPRVESTPPRQSRVIDWATLRSEAEAFAIQQSGDNPWGFNQQAWQKQEQRWANRKFTDDGFAAGMARSREWDDLELLLGALEQLGARPFILSMPISGLFLDHLGTSSASRQKFYTQLRALVESHHASVDVFAEHDTDKYFIGDPGDHLGAEGWVYYVQALDSFYHDSKR